jgi:hypothetical protein
MLSVECQDYYTGLQPFDVTTRGIAYKAKNKVLWTIKGIFVYLPRRILPKK